MANLTRRNGELKRLLGQYLAPASAYTVIAYEVGAEAVSNTGATITVRSGHGFAAGDKILKNPGSDNTYSGTISVSSVTATTLVMTGTFDVVAGDVLFNLGADQGTSTPIYNASGVTIYSDMDGTTSITSSSVTTDSEGEYGYWHNVMRVWELVIGSNGPEAVVLDATLSGVRSGSTTSTDNAIVRWDGTDGTTIQDYTSGAPTVSDTGTVIVPSVLSVTGYLSNRSEQRRNHILSVTRSPYSDVALYYRDDHDKDHYRLMLRLDTVRWWMQDFDEGTGTGSTTCNFMGYGSHIAKAFLSVPHDDVSVVETGTWTAGGSNAAAYNNTYRASVTASDTVEWTTPADVTAVGIRTVCGTNGGLAQVSIDGDATAATLLYTAQDLVDLGEYPNTILVANGGSLNPTDRVLDFCAGTGLKTNYAPTLEYDVFIPFVDGLGAAAHVVLITVTGYKRSVATDYRVWSSGYMYRTDATLMSDADVDPMRVESFFRLMPWFASSEEYAIYFHPTGDATGAWIGNRAHGYDNQTAIAFRLDGAALTPTKDGLNLGSGLEITRTTEWFHPNYASGASKVADTIVVYTMTQDGLSVTRKTTWLITGTVTTAYPAMLSFSRDLLNKALIGSSTADYTLTGSNANYGYSRPGTDIACAWDPDGNKAVVLYVPDTLTSCNDFPMTTHKVFVLDEDTYVYGKLYFSRSRSGQVDEAVVNGTVHRSQALYRACYMAQPDIVLGIS